MVRTFSGKTGDAGGAILGASFWVPGVTLKGKFVRWFQTANGRCNEFSCISPKDIKVTLDTRGRVIDPRDADETSVTKEVDRFSVGALAGFEMACDAVRGKSDGGFEDFRFGDIVEITCTGSQETDKGNPMPEFEISVSR